MVQVDYSKVEKFICLGLKKCLKMIKLFFLKMMFLLEECKHIDTPNKSNVLFYLYFNNFDIYHQYQSYLPLFDQSMLWNIYDIANFALDE